jgi:hypothetical protein
MSLLMVFVTVVLNEKDFQSNNCAGGVFVCSYDVKDRVTECPKHWPTLG